jgi:hypothetical protein
MTTIDREIIQDLMPLYRSGLASAPSRRLVQAWLEAHPSEPGASRKGNAGASADSAAPLARARGLQRRLRWLHSLAVTFTILCFSSEFHVAGGRLVSAQLLALIYPQAFVPVAIVALGCWAGYLLLKRRLG